MSGVEARIPLRGVRDLVREDVQQDLGIRVRVDVAAVVAEELAAQLVGIDQVAVVAEHDAVRRIHVERLRLGLRGGAARGGIAAVGDAHVADEVAHVARAEHVAHQAAPLCMWKLWPSAVTMPAASWPRCCSTVIPS
jgi:hypothetical protein